MLNLLMSRPGNSFTRPFSWCLVREFCSYIHFLGCEEPTTQLRCKQTVNTSNCELQTTVHWTRFQIWHVSRQISNDCHTKASDLRLWHWCEITIHTLVNTCTIENMDNFDKNLHKISTASNPPPSCLCLLTQWINKIESFLILFI